MNNIGQFRLSWILFKQSVSVSRRAMYLAIWHIHYNLKGCYKINVLLQWVIGYVHIE